MKILVGSGPSLLKKDNGHIIDSYEKVIRFNDYVIKGYEKQVGTRTDILWTTTLINYKSLAEYEYVIIYLLLQNHPQVDPALWKSGNIISQLDRFYAAMVSWHVGLKAGCWPSTGLAAICFYLSLGENIAITGYDNFQTGYTDYFRDGWTRGGDNHDGQCQARFIDKMVKEGRITII